MKLNNRAIKNIVERILSYPLASECNVEELIPQVQDDFPQYDEFDIEELISDVSSKHYESFCSKLIGAEGNLNSGAHKFADLFIFPSNRSKTLANNDVPEFERLFYENANLMSDFDKGRYFESVVKYLFSKIGLELDTTASSGDNGIDLIGQYNDDFAFGEVISVFIQCKYYDSSIDINVVKKVCSDITFNILSPHELLNHPVKPFLVIKEGASRSAKMLAEEFGVQILELTTLINIAAEKGRLDFLEFANMG